MCCLKREQNAIFQNISGLTLIGGSSELPMWLTDEFLVTFLKVEGSSVHNMQGGGGIPNIQNVERSKNFKFE